jgi:amphi-Trp domain-containing protein
MSDRDVEKVKDREYFVATLRRVADAIEQGQAFRIQVAEQRFSVPADAEMSIEHEVQDGKQELELQLRWSD